LIRCFYFDLNLCWIYEWIQIHLKKFPLVFNFMEYFSIFPYQWPKWKEISSVTCISDQFPPQGSLPWSHLRPFPIARSALTGLATDPCWKFPEIGQCRDLSMIKFQTQKLIQMAPHHCTLTECLEPSTFLAPACYKESMRL
jgi:hypothetical protein